jgi:hypothetical protein
VARPQSPGVGRFLIHAERLSLHLAAVAQLHVKNLARRHDYMRGRKQITIFAHNHAAAGRIFQVDAHRRAEHLVEVLVRLLLSFL